VHELELWDPAKEVKLRDWTLMAVHDVEIDIPFDFIFLWGLALHSHGNKNSLEFIISKTYRLPTEAPLQKKMVHSEMTGRINSDQTLLQLKNWRFYRKMFSISKNLASFWGRDTNGCRTTKIIFSIFCGLGKLLFIMCRYRLLVCIPRL
jgi:hypothetical protein